MKNSVNNLESEKVASAKYLAQSIYTSAGLKSKYTGECLSVVGGRVASFLDAYEFNEDVVSAGYLHAVLMLEAAKADQLMPALSSTSIRYLTDIYIKVKISAGPRAFRKKQEADLFEKIPSISASIKTAETIVFLEMVEKHDKSFLPIYVNEKEYLIGKLPNQGEPIWEAAMQLISDIQSRLYKQSLKV